MAMAVNVDTRQTIAAYRILFLKSLTAQNCSTISTAPSDKIDTCDHLTHCTNKNKELDLIQFSSAVKFWITKLLSLNLVQWEITNQKKKKE